MIEKEKEGEEQGIVVGMGSKRVSSRKERVVAVVVEVARKGKM
jgi:hypothetical protein